MGHLVSFMSGSDARMLPRKLPRTAGTMYAKTISQGSGVPRGISVRNSAGGLDAVVSENSTERQNSHLRHA